MSDHAELHSKILRFLMEQWALKDNRQLVAVKLLFAPGGGFKDEVIREWVRTDHPELFAEFVSLEKLVTEIVQIAEDEADSKPPGKHQFILRTHQHLGGTARHSFALSPGFRGGDETAIVHGGAGPSKGGEVAIAQILANNNSQLMRTNQQMFDGAFRILGHSNMSLHEQVATLTAENTMLRRELEEARSNKMDREFQIAMAAEKNARTNAGFQKLLQIGTVVAAKIGAGDEQQPGGASPIAMLLGEFYTSLRQDQLAVLMQTLDMPQKIMFMEIVNLVRPPDQDEGKSAPRSPGGGGGGGGSSNAPSS